MAGQSGEGIDKGGILEGVAGTPIPIPFQKRPSPSLPPAREPASGEIIPTLLLPPEPPLLVRRRHELAAGVMLAVGLGWLAVAEALKTWPACLAAALFTGTGVSILARAILRQGLPGRRSLP